MKRNNYWNLTKRVTGSVFADKGLLVTLVIAAIVNLGANILIITLFNSNDSEGEIYDLVFYLFLLVTFTLGCFCILVIVKIFSTQFYEKIISLEKHTGYSNKQIYISRIVAFLITYVILMVVILIINTVTYFYSVFDEISIALFFMIIGWYLIFGFMIASITILCSAFFKPIILVTFSTVLTIATIISILIVNVFVPYKNESLKNSLDHTGSIVANDVYEQKINEIVNSSKELKTIFDEKDLLAKYFSTSGPQPPIEQIIESFFILGPAFWEKKYFITIPDDYLNSEYKKMVDYIHEIFKPFTSFVPKTKSLLFSDRDKRYYDTNYQPYFKFIEQNNVKYPEINKLQKLFITNSFAKNSIRLENRLFFLNTGPETVIKDIDECYDNLGEFVFLSTFNKMLCNYGKPRENYEEANLVKSFDKMFWKNLFNPLSHLSIMLYGQNYGDDWIYYEILSFMKQSPKTVNIRVKEKVLEDGTKVNSYYQPIRADVIYVIYATGISLIIFGSYFIYRKKISQ